MAYVKCDCIEHNGFSCCMLNYAMIGGNLCFYSAFWFFQVFKDQEKLGLCAQTPLSTSHNNLGSKCLKLGGRLLKNVSLASGVPFLVTSSRSLGPLLECQGKTYKEWGHGNLATHIWIQNILKYLAEQIKQPCSRNLPHVNLWPLT